MCAPRFHPSAHYIMQCCTPELRPVKEFQTFHGGDSTGTCKVSLKFVSKSPLGAPLPRMKNPNLRRGGMQLREVHSALGEHTIFEIHFSNPPPPRSVWTKHRPMALCDDVHVAGRGEHLPLWGLRDDHVPRTDQAVRGGRHGQRLHTGGWREAGGRRQLKTASNLGLVPTPRRILPVLALFAFTGAFCSGHCFGWTHCEGKGSADWGEWYSGRQRSRG